MSDKNNTEDKKKSIINKYINFVSDNKRLPTVSDMHSLGVTRDAIRHHFSNITRLHDFMADKYKKKLEKYIVNESALFTPKNLEKLNDVVENHKRFVVTTVVAGKKINKDFLNSVRNYCRKNDAKLLIMLAEDAASRRRENGGFIIPSEIADDTIVFNDVRFNENFMISTIKVSAKHINPLTGLSRISQRNGSMILASPKQFLEYVATSPKADKIPHALMTTGALTENNYSTDLYMSQRTSYIAENDHVMGGIIVEVENDRTFHFRQIQADEKGSFIDLGKRYNSNGTIGNVTTNLVLGDWHCGDTADDVKENFADMCHDLQIQDVFLHDLFNGHSISHHDLGSTIKMAQKSLDNRLSLQKEIEDVGDDLNFILEHIKGNAIVVKSNHDEWIDRYLERAGYIYDPDNHYISLLMAQKMYENQDPLKYAVGEYGNVSRMNRIIWLRRDDEFKIGNVELAAHGDLGSNGARGSLQSLEKAYGNCVVGHTHGGAIYRGVFRVGTSTDLQLGYNRGPSSWTKTHCLVYPNGSRQLINVIDGKWRMKDESN